MACKSCDSTGACSCVSNYKELNLGTRTIWTLGGNAPGGVDVVMSVSAHAAIAPTLDKIQATVTVTNASSGFKAQVYYQISADGVTWDTAVFFNVAGANPPAAQTGNGTLVFDWLTGTQFKRFIRFGVHAEQASGTNVIAIAEVSLVIGMLIK
jgi:hypothetical protein